MKPFSRRGVIKAAAGLIAFIPAARNLLEMAPVAAMPPPDCDCSCLQPVRYSGPDCATYCNPPYQGCTAPVYAIYTTECCNYPGQVCDTTATIIGRAGCPY